MRGLNFQLARITIEALTPFAVGAGRGDDLVDSVWVTDANGLPAIPGTSLAGVLRAAVVRDQALNNDTGRSIARDKSLFGYQDGNVGKASRVELSWAQVHDESDTPVPFRGARLDSEILGFLASGLRRDHVRINSSGVADSRGKFDEALIPRGARFTFELRIDQGSREELELLLMLLDGAAMRIGGRTRRGFGCIKVICANVAHFDLSKVDDRRRYQMLPTELHKRVPDGILSPWAGSVHQGGRWKSIRISLLPEDFWMIGGGENSSLSMHSVDRVSDICPYTERMIKWRNGKASVVSAVAVVPASSVKGALRHRVAFHALRQDLIGLAEPTPHMTGPRHHLSIDELPEVCSLFGQLLDTSNKRGRPGRVFLKDIYISSGNGAPKGGWLDHVSVNRFTGGALDGRLFSEAPLFGGGYELELLIDSVGIDENSRLALFRALRDLCEGRLAIGAGGNRGHGFMKGQLDEHADGVAWLRGAA